MSPVTSQPGGAPWPMQARWWPLLAEVDAPANCRALLVNGRIDVALLVEAIHTVVEDHPVLRSRLSDADGVLRLHDPCLPVTVVVRAADPAECARTLRERAGAAHDPRHDPLVRFDVVRLAPDQLVLAMTAHLLAADLGSLYGTLGAVLRAYAGRYRPDRSSSPPQIPPASTSREAWWSQRLATWQRAGTLTAALGRPDPVGRTTTTQVQTVDGSAWQRLADRAEAAGGSADLAVVALLAAWRAARSAHRGTAVFAAWTDLRPTHGGHRLIGPISDQIAFAVDLEGHADLTFDEMLRRTRAGLLDTMVRYIPYDDLRRLHRLHHPGAPPPWDLRVHFCRFRPRSAFTRGEESLAALGLSVELFRESELLVAPPLSGPATWDGVSADLFVTEHGTEDVALTLQHDVEAVDATTASLILRSISDMIGVVAAGSGEPLSRWVMPGTAEDGSSPPQAFSPVVSHPLRKDRYR